MLVLLVLLRMLHLVQPMELPSNLPRILLVVEGAVGQSEILLALDTVPATLRTKPTRRYARPTRGCARPTRTTPRARPHLSCCAAACDGCEW